ncbi:hypothetical protein [Streptomyces sp. NPDC029003]
MIVTLVVSMRVVMRIVDVLSGTAHDMGAFPKQQQVTDLDLPPNQP